MDWRLGWPFTEFTVITMTESKKAQKLIELVRGKTVLREGR